MLIINLTEGIKQRFEQTYDMIYCSVQYVLAIGIKGRKIEVRSTKLYLFIKAT